MSRILAIIRWLLCAADRLANPPPSVPVTDLASPAGDVGGNAVSTHIESELVQVATVGFTRPDAPMPSGLFTQFGNETDFATKVVATGPRLSHDVPTLPVRAERVVMSDSDIEALIDADDRFVAEMPPTLPVEVEPFPHPKAGTQLFPV